MTTSFSSFARCALPLAAVLVLAGCGSFDRLTSGFAGSLSPYKVEIVQGNFVSKEQVEALKVGMSRQQVREVLGTPLLASVFHSDRWEYVFTLKREGVEPQARRLTVYFSGESLARFEGDEMLSEADFVTLLDTRRKLPKVPVLEATPDELKAAARTPPAADATAAPLPATPGSYPPLEAPAR
jgi:outer membrane protein assembly factor BamE